MIADYSVRFQDAAWYSNSRRSCVVGGAGGIGSWLSLFLVRAGFDVTAYDMDEYEKHNIGGQFCKTSDVGKTKIEALEVNIRDFTDRIISTALKFDYGSYSERYMFSAFDNMEARKTMFELWVKYYGGSKDSNGIFIDGRLLAEQLQIFAIKAGSPEIEIYRNKFLFNDSEVEDATCSFKQTTHVAAMIASLMVSTFTNHIANTMQGNTARKVPFFMEYFTPLHFLNFQPDVE